MARPENGEIGQTAHSPCPYPKSHELGITAQAAETDRLKASPERAKRADKRPQGVC
jgi:hypothetical protein